MTLKKSTGNVICHPQSRTIPYKLGERLKEASDL